jgi:threonine/homoserine/homoserine lactone efflux protein
LIHFISGFAAGFLSSIGVGPTNMIVIGCGLAGAFPAALAAGLGAFTTDAIFMTLAIKGVSLASPHHVAVLAFRGTGTMILIAMGALTVRHSMAGRFRPSAHRLAPWKAYVAGTGLCISNPAILGFWFAVLIWFHEHGVNVTVGWQGALFVLGACTGGMTWFTFAAVLSHSVRRFLSGKLYHSLVRAGGLLLLGLALFWAVEFIHDLY